jgi:ATP-dependent Lon protease
MTQDNEKIKPSEALGNGTNGINPNQHALNPEKKRAVLPSLNFFPLRGTVMFPFSLSTLVVEGDANIAMIEKVSSGNRTLALFPEIIAIPKNEKKKEHPDFIEMPVPIFSLEEKQYSQIGIVGRIVKMLRFPDGAVRLLVRGVKRIKFIKSITDQIPIVVEAEEIPRDDDESLETVAMAKNTITQFHEIISSSPFYPEDLKIAIMNVNNNERVADLIADTLNFTFEEKLVILAASTLHARFQFLTILLNREIEILNLGTKIQSQVSSAIGQTQREYFLREQLKSIKKELGEETKNPDVATLLERASKKKMPPKIKEVFNKELERLQMIHQASAEYNVAHTYLDWLLDLPWEEYSEDRIEISEASKILNNDHYDLKDVKERILDFLAVLQLKKNRKSPILCFMGPPGVGKTSLGQSIARAMKRNFVRMSLGGIKDEAEIRGHRRTYVGALPGRIIQGIKKAKSANPVFMLDEIDKIGSDFRGDPASALLEVLDPAQNNSFNDHYIELDFDLSSVFFIATANISDTIPPALLDRMEIIRLPGYTTMEKIEIAKQYIIPRQITENGLLPKRLIFTEKTIKHIIQNYTLEAGVRNLERSIEAVCRKFAREIVENKRKSKGKMFLTENLLKKYLGPKKFFHDVVESKKNIPGVATGMAWTSFGGSIMPVEIRKMPGKGNLKMTGSLGDIMKESAEIAFSYIRSCHDTFKLPKDIFSKNDFHIHVPDGATPKDGPSAGITICIAALSLLQNKTIPTTLAMTGEINLQGKINPVGGIKEKVIAALAAGVKKIILPEKNKKDLDILPAEIKKNINFKFCSNISEVANFAFQEQNKKYKKA